MDSFFKKMLGAVRRISIVEMGVAALLLAALKWLASGLRDTIIFDWLKERLFALLFPWLGVGNVNALANFFAFWLLPFALAVGLVWFAFHRGKLAAAQLTASFDGMLSIDGKPSEDDARRITLVDFANIAANDFGWKFGNDSFESLDFIRAVKQAHVDGAIELDGRLGCDGKEEDSILWHPLVAIPRNHLTRPNWDFDVPHFFNGTRNFDISTYRMGGSAEGRYRDIHVRNKAKALEWLKVDAQAYRGVTEQLETKRQDRVSEWKDLRAIGATDRGSGDLGLDDLFDYLMNKAKAFKKIADSGERHDAVDIALRDALGLGRLLSYGRPAGDWIDRMADALSTMRIIETAFWSNGAEIEWATIDSTAPRHQRCVAKSRDGNTYYDLQFDTAQVEKLWPA